jgi:hypothetical protein
MTMMGRQRAAIGGGNAAESVRGHRVARSESVAESGTGVGNEVEVGVVQAGVRRMDTAMTGRPGPGM